MTNLMGLMDKCNYNLHSRTNGGVSILGDIQQELVGMLPNMNLSNDQVESFGANLVGTPEMFDDPSKYASVANVYNVFNDYKKSMVQETQKTM